MISWPPWIEQIDRVDRYRSANTILPQRRLIIEQKGMPDFPQNHSMTFQTTSPTCKEELSYAYKRNGAVWYTYSTSHDAGTQAVILQVFHSLFLPASQWT